MKLISEVEKPDPLTGGTMTVSEYETEDGGYCMICMPHSPTHNPPPSVAAVFRRAGFTVIEIPDR